MNPSNMWSSSSSLRISFLILFVYSAQVIDANQQGAHIYKEDNGSPIPSYTVTRTCGKNGPIVLEDVTLIQHLAHFDREKSPDRVVHAKGGGAFGYFEVTHDITQYSKAVVFSKIGLKTPMVARFSTVTNEAGGADTVRDPRGFSLRFYTEKGNWDLVGNNTPIFFVRDPMLFMAFIHSQKRNPVTHRKDPNMAWDFVSQRHETLFQMLITFSDAGTPDGFRYMNGFGSHTFVLVNEHNEPTYCKFHFLSDQGIKNLTAEEATRLAGTEPDYSIKDLYEAIDNHDYPSWTMYLQVMSFDRANRVKFNVLDVTKMWPESDFPLIPVGRMVLNRNAQNYFAEIEQLAFDPSNLIPGIQPSRDKMLQARLFSYKDTQRHRLGPNFIQIPVNSPLKPNHIVNLQRDGPGLIYHQDGEPNYYPNSFSPYRPDIEQDFMNYTIDGVVMRHDTSDADNYSQAREFYAAMADHDKAALAKNIGNNLKDVKEPIAVKVIRSFGLISSELSSGIEYHMRK
ncbi:unnamed protein product [Bemisia tabaci]|uniref:Catalase core domain-containing protein n=1 Tax=Bemisia tabaci TaxID=7038 RepID=A0A9P0A4U0_BEMTA|nr:unnamed protein product [Bemisia tabaci]